MPDAFPASYANPADMTARFRPARADRAGPVAGKRCPGRCGRPLFADDWPQADKSGEASQPPAYDVERVATALDQASRRGGQLPGRAPGRAADTTAGVPQPLRAFVCDMARYHLTAGFGMQVPEDVEARYKAALAWLKDVAKGAAEIVVPTPRTLRSRTPRNGVSRARMP